MLTAFEAFGRLGPATGPSGPVGASSAPAPISPAPPPPGPVACQLGRPVGAQCGGWHEGRGFVPAYPARQHRHRCSP